MSTNKTITLALLLTALLFITSTATAQFYYSDGRQIPLGEILLDRTAIVSSIV